MTREPQGLRDAHEGLESGHPLHFEVAQCAFRDTGAAGDFRAREQLREPLGLQPLAKGGANFRLSCQRKAQSFISCAHKYLIQYQYNSSYRRRTQA